MKMKVFGLLFVFAAAGVLPGQDPMQGVEDAFRELKTDALTLRFFNAMDGNPIPGGAVVIEHLGEFRTDTEGKAVFPIPEQDGVYKVVFSKQGYITSEFPIEIQAGTMFFNRFSVSPALPLGNMRIVLDWDASPRDLDLHFVKMNQYHISYRNMRTSSDGVVRLDRDDRNGYGPETVTVKRIENSATYYCLVHDYSNRHQAAGTGLSRSKATIKVYSGNALLHVIPVPRNTPGTYWQAFRIAGGEIDILGTLHGREPDI